MRSSSILLACTRCRCLLQSLAWGCHWGACQDGTRKRVPPHSGTPPGRHEVDTTEPFNNDAELCAAQDDIYDIITQTIAEGGGIDGWVRVATITQIAWHCEWTPQQTQTAIQRWERLGVLENNNQMNNSLAAVRLI